MKLSTVLFCCALGLGATGALADNDWDEDDYRPSRWASYDTQWHPYCDDERHYHPHHHRHGRFDDDAVYARVLDVQRIYRVYDVPVGERYCLDRNPRYRSHTSYVGTVAGAVIGGALGHRIGDAHGEADVAAISGGLLGAAVGRDLDRRAADNYAARGSRNCRVAYHRQRELVEYKVRYRYNGRVHVAHMDHDPGRWIKLDVDINPT